MKRREFVSKLASVSVLGATVPAEVFASAPSNPTLMAINEVAGKDFIRVSLGVGYLYGIVGRNEYLWDVAAGRIADARDQLSRLGIIFPVTRYVDNLSLPENAYTISVYGQLVHEGTVTPALAASSGRWSKQETINEMDLILDQLIAIAKGCQHLWPVERADELGRLAPTRQTRVAS